MLRRLALLAATAALSTVAPAADALSTEWATKPVPIESFAQFPQIERPRLSLDGKWIATKVRAGEQQVLAIIPVGDSQGKAKLIAKDGETSGKDQIGERQIVSWRWIDGDTLIFTLRYPRRGGPAQLSRVVRPWPGMGNGVGQVLGLWHTGRSHIKCAIVATLVVLFDCLFPNSFAGARIGAFAGTWLIGLMLGRRDVRRHRPAWIALAAAAFFTASLFDDPGPLAWTLFWCALSGAALLPKTTGFDDAWHWSARYAIHAGAGIGRPIADLGWLWRAPVGWRRQSPCLGPTHPNPRPGNPSSFRRFGGSIGHFAPQIPQR